jgi:hypothetical protein
MNQHVPTTIYMRSLIYGHHQHEYHCLYMYVGSKEKKMGSHWPKVACPPLEADICFSR